MRVTLLSDVEAGGATVHLLVRLEAEGAVEPDRKPVNLSLVIDRSSSMRGPRIAQACRAARMLVDQLTERDRLSIITFDGGARVLFGPAGVDDAGRAELAAALADIETGVGTNLAAGIKKGAEAIRSGFVRGAVSRLILLTDGQPSVGITDADRLGTIVENELGRGVTTTTMGLGEGFDDEMLAMLAQRGRGGFYYLAHPADIPAAFGQELAGVFAIAATKTELKLLPHKDVVQVEVAHRLPSRPLADGLMVEVGELAAGAPRQVLFRLTRLADADSDTCGTVAVSYRQADGSVGDGHVIGIELPRSPLGPHAGAVTLERLRLAAAGAVDAVWAHRASREIKLALADLERLRVEILAARNQGVVDPAELDPILEDMAEAEQAVAKSADERERARRLLRERSHITLLGQSRVSKLPSDDE